MIWSLLTFFLLGMSVVGHSDGGVLGVSSRQAPCPSFLNIRDGHAGEVFVEFSSSRENYAALAEKV